VLHYEWLVTWTKSGPFEQGHEIHGVISVANPGDQVIAVDVADTITGLTVVINCGSGDGDTTLDVRRGVHRAGSATAITAPARDTLAKQNNALVSFGDSTFRQRSIEWTPTKQSTTRDLIDPASPASARRERQRFGDLARAVPLLDEPHGIHG